jgi:hypothetical protein
MWSSLNSSVRLKNRIVILSIFLFLCIFSLQVVATDAPVITAGRVINATPGSVPIPVTVTNFNNIGQFTLTLKFDTTKVRYVPASAVTNPALSGMAVTYTPPSGNTQGKLVFTWTGAVNSNVSLPDGSTLATLTFSYITATGILNWAYTYGDICQYKSYVGGILTALNDTPKYLFYLNGGISNRSAPVTYAPNIVSPTPGALLIPITANGFTNIGALTLYLEYDPAIITYQNTFTKNAVFNSSFLVGDIAGTGTKRLLVIQWYGSAQSLANGSTLCTLNFNYLTAGTNCALNWFDNGPSCEYADGSGNALIDMPFGDYYKNGGIAVPMVNIILRKSSNCGDFNVLLKPTINLQANLTKVIFTVKWAATAGSDVQLTNISANWPNLQQVGNRELYGGYYYVNYSSLTTYAVNWTANSENNIMNFRHSGIGDGSCDFTIITTDYNTIPPGLNTAWHIEIASVNATGSVTNDANGVSLNCGLYAKDFLQGPYNTTSHLMNTNLATANYIPLTQPYNVTPWLYAGTEHISSYPTGTVDWVLVELRSAITSNTVIERRACLLKNDGTIMDINGVSPVVFRSFVPGNAYYVVVYHRSHFPVMTANAITLPNTLATKHDFTTNPASNVYSNTNAGVILLETGVYGQIVGDINYDNKLKISGSGNDRLLVITKIIALFSPPPASLISTISGYYAEDMNMNGVVKYSGSQNDPSTIFTALNALINPPALNSVYQGQVPVSYAAKAVSSTIKESEYPGYIYIKSFYQPQSFIPQLK